MRRVALYDSLDHLTEPTGEDNRRQRQFYRAILQEGMKTQLTARQREAITLYYGEGLTLAQVGERLGVSPSAAGFRGRKNGSKGLPKAVSPCKNTISLEIARRFSYNKDVATICPQKNAWACLSGGGQCRN